MTQRSMPALLVVGLLATALSSSAAPGLAEQKAARLALRKSHQPATVAPAPAAPAMPEKAQGLSDSERAEKAAAEQAGAPALRYQTLQRRLADGQALGAEDKRFLMDYTRNAAPKGGGHAVDEGGPDAFGNTWIMTGDTGGPAYSWVAVPEQDRTYLTLGDDDYAGPIDMGGVFSYYGTSYSQVFVGSNGTVSFAEDGMWSLWGFIPDPNTPNAVLALFWDDLLPAAGGTVYTATVGGNCVVTWDQVVEFGGEGTITAQMVFDLGGSTVDFNYAAFDEGIDTSNCTIGIENEDGSDGLLVLSAGSPFAPSAETTIRFTIAPPADYAAAFVPGTLELQVGSPGVIDAQVTVYNTGLLAHSMALDANLETLDIELLDADGQLPVTGTPVLQPGSAFTFTVRVEAEEGLGQMVDTGLVLAVSGGDGSETLLPVEVGVVSTHGGPDAFGNTWAMSGDSQGTDYFWVDLPVEDRTVAALFDDSSVGPIDLGGVLSYYGTARSEFYIGSNGYIGFLPDNMNSLGNMPLPDATEWNPSSIICLFWDDINPGAGGQVYYGHDGEGRLVITWGGVPEFGGSGTLTAQIVIDFETQQVFLNYAALEGGIIVNECTVGIENDSSDDALQVIFDGTPFLPTAQNTIRIDLAPPPQYAVDLPAALELAGSYGGTYETELTLFNAGLLPETFDLAIGAEGSEYDWSLLDAQGNPITSIGPVPSLVGVQVTVRLELPEDTGVLEEVVTLTATCQHDTGRFDTTQIRGLIVATSGTDDWGNNWMSSLAPDGPPSIWIELDEQDRTYVDFPGGTWSVSGPFPLATPLAFYGGSYGEFYVSSKGFIGFDPEGMAPWGVMPIPSPDLPNAQVYLFWDDLNVTAPSGGSVYYGTDDEGRLVVTFDQVRRNWDGPGWITAQVVVNAANNELLLNYHEAGGNMDLGLCTVGLENEDGTVAMPIMVANQPYHPTPGLTIRVDLAPPPDYWFGMDDFVSNAGAIETEVAGSFTIYNTGLVADSYGLDTFNEHGFDTHAEINGIPVTVTPAVQPGSSITVDLVAEIPELPPSTLSYSTLTATSTGDPGLQRSGQMETRIVLVQGGPDGGGYFWSTTDADGQVEYSWETMTNPVTVGLTDDSYAGPFDLGFTWTHYGQDFTQVYIASNGYIGFVEEAMWTIGGQDMPDPFTPNGIICGFMDDLNPGQGGTVSYSAQGDRFVVTFDAVPEYFDPGTITFQFVLDMDEEAVRINYQTLNGMDTSFFTIGQEDAAGSQGFTASLWGQGWLPSNESSVWFGFNVIGPSGPYAVDMDPDESSGVGINGGYAEYEFEVENRGENASTFDLSVSGNIWDVSFHDIENGWAAITQVPSIAYDQVFALGVRVHVPEQPASYTDQALVRVEATGHTEAFAESNILTAASCNHVDQMIANVTGNGLFGMAHLSDGEYTDNNTLVFVGSGVNRMITLGMDGTVGPISVLPAGHDYLGIAYDSRDNSYWVSYAGGISHVSAAGALVAAFTPPLLAASTGRVPTGLAYDADNEILWAICSHGATDDFVRIDVSDASNPVGLNAMTVPWSAAPGSGAAGLDYHQETNQLVALHTGTGNSECFLDLGNGGVDARGDFCPSGLAEGHGLALTPDGDLYIGWTSGLAHPVDQYRAPCDFGVAVEDRPLLPLAFELGANYPNPFNPSTTLGYALPAAGQVQLEVYNLMGQRLATLVDGVRPAGYHEVLFDGSALASGVYVYRVSVTDLAGRPQYHATRKMIMIK
jgi:hypothetical protein